MIKFHSDLCWRQTLADRNGLSLLLLGQQFPDSQSSDPNRFSRLWCLGMKKIELFELWGGSQV